MQVNDQAINLSAANDYQHSGQGKTVNVTVHKYREGLGQAVHMTTALYNFLVHATPKQWDEAVQEDLRCRTHHLSPFLTAALLPCISFAPSLLLSSVIFKMKREEADARGGLVVVDVPYEYMRMQ